MTVAWPTVKAAIVEFAKLTNVIADDRQIYWDEESKPNAHGDFLLLTISDERQIGSDDIEDIEVDDGAGGTHWVPRITGIREFVCEFRYRSRSAKGTRAARHALETIRASLEHPTRRAVLDDASVGFLSADPIRTENVEHDQRRESIAVLPVRFSALSELLAIEAEEAQPRTQAIELVIEVAGQVVDEANAVDGETIFVP